MPEQQMNSEIRECITSCLDCYSICQETINYCLQRGGRHADVSHIRLLTDCAEACQINSSFMLRNSDLYMSTCSVCAEVCDACAESCEAFASEAQMTACADLCRNCADLCDRVSQQTLAA